MTTLAQAHAFMHLELQGALRRLAAAHGWDAVVNAAIAVREQCQREERARRDAERKRAMDCMEQMREVRRS